MTSTLTETDAGVVVRPPRVLVPLIKAELEAGAAAGIEHYRRAGEMLLEAKRQLSPDEWRGWLERHFHLSATSAYRYMRLVEATTGFRARKFATMSQATEPGREPHHRPAWHTPVKETVARVDMKALVQDQQSREKERKLIQKLGLQLIDIGYKVLAAKLHPDKGGSSEAMARLNKVRSILKGAL